MARPNNRGATNMTTPIKPLHDFVVVVREEPETTTASGLVLVERDPQQTATIGNVIAVGPGTTINDKWDPMVVAVGDRVLFGKGTGQIVELEKKKYLFIKQRDLMGIVK